LISLAIAGKKGSGKDTLGQVATQTLTERHSWTYLHQPLARALKNQIDQALEAARTAGRGNAEQAVADNLALELDVATQLVARLRIWPAGTSAWDTNVDQVRPTLVWYGRQRRNQRPGYWLEQCLTAAARHRLDGDQPTLVTDVRFPNEADAFTATPDQDGPYADLASLPDIMRPWLLVRIDTSTEIRHQRLRQRDGHLDLDTEADASETGLDSYTGWDLTVNNDGDPQAAAAQIVDAVEQRASS
jgi:ribose 1,5-bisphosphokinase PhnN